MPSHSHVYKQPTARVPPPPSPPSQQQRSRGGSIGKSSVAPLSARTPPPPPCGEKAYSPPLSTRTPPPPPTHEENTYSSPPLSPPTSKQVDQNRKAAPPPPPRTQQPQVQNFPLKSPRDQFPQVSRSPSLSSSSPGAPSSLTGNPYKSSISPPIVRKPSINSTMENSAPMIVTSSSISMYSPNPLSAVSSPAGVFSPVPRKRTAPPKPSLGGTPSADTISSPATSRSETPVSHARTNTAPPVPSPRKAPPPTAARTSVVGLKREPNPLASSAPTIISRTPLVSGSPLVLSSPAVVSSPVMTSSPAARTPNIMSPPVPLRRPSLMSSNHDNGSDDHCKTNTLKTSSSAPKPASPMSSPGAATQPRATAVNSLKVSVGIMRPPGGIENSSSPGNASPSIVPAHSNSNGNNGNNGNNNANSGGDSEYRKTINALRQTHLLKSPLVRDYLNLAAGTHSANNSPAVPRRATTNRRSVTPPPARSSGFDSPTRPRKLSDPVPLSCNILTRKVELLGSEEGISMPYNVTHTTHVDVHNFGLLAKDDNHLLLSQSNILSSGKTGYLYKLSGYNFRERWLECKGSTLSYYRKQGDSKPRGEIFLVDCEFNRDRLNKRKYTLHVFATSTKKHYYFSAMTDEMMEEWVRAFQSGGAIDKDLVEFEQLSREQEKKAEEARKARELRKLENEYVKEKIKKRSTLKISNKNMTDAAIKDCRCELSVTEAATLDEGRVVFKIEVTFDDQKWTIFRKYDKVTALYNAVYKLKFTKSMCPPKKAPSNMSEAEFSKVQVSKLQELLDALAQNRTLVLSSQTSKQGYLRFLAPVGWEDIKPDDFIMPYSFDF